MFFRSTVDVLFADLSATELLVVTIGADLTLRESVQVKSHLTFGDIMAGRRCGC